MEKEKEKLIAFINKQRKKIESKKVGIAVPSLEKQQKTPWYKRPLEHEEFTSRQAKNQRWYVRHKEWSKNIWVGPYKDQADCNNVINSYVEVSLKCSIFGNPLPNKIHSVTIDNPNDFFLKTNNNC